MGHKELLTDLIEELKTEELPFYERTAIRNWWFWHSAAGIVLVSTLGATVAASLMKATDSGGHGEHAPRNDGLRDVRRGRGICSPSNDAHAHAYAQGLENGGLSC